MYVSWMWFLDLVSGGRNVREKISAGKVVSLQGTLGLINQWFPLNEALINHYFLGGYVVRGGLVDDRHKDFSPRNLQLHP